MSRGNQLASHSSCDQIIQVGQLHKWWTNKLALKCYHLQNPLSEMFVSTDLDSLHLLSSLPLVTPAISIENWMKKVVSSTHLLATMTLTAGRKFSAREDWSACRTMAKMRMWCCVPVFRSYLSLLFHFYRQKRATLERERNKTVFFI